MRIWNIVPDENNDASGLVVKEQLSHVLKQDHLQLSSLLSKNFFYVIWSQSFFWRPQKLPKCCKPSKQELRWNDLEGVFTHSHKALVYCEKQKKPRIDFYENQFGTFCWRYN